MEHKGIVRHREKDIWQLPTMQQVEGALGTTAESTRAYGKDEYPCSTD